MYLSLVSFEPDVYSLLFKSFIYQSTLGQINSTIFGLDESAVISTYYFRLRTFDAKNNFADWSGPLSASYIDASLYVSIDATTHVCKC